MSYMDKQEFRFKISGKTLVIIDWANVYGWFSNPSSKTYLGWEVDPKKLFAYLKSYSNITDINFYFGVESNKPKSVIFEKEIKSIGYSHKSKEVKWVPASLDTSHFKSLLKELISVLNGIKNTNFNITKKLHDSAYSLTEELDEELKKLNIRIDELKNYLLEPVMRRKCDFDVEIARDVFNFSNDFENLILFSGDGDYVALVEDLILTKNKKVIVVFASGHKGKEYTQLQEKLIKEKLSFRLFLCSVNNLKNFIIKYPQGLLLGA